MPRDSGGNYTLPSGNPVVSGTVIESIWANDTMSDIAVQLNNVITRDGLLGPLLPFLVVDGTVALPGLAFALAPSTGLYRFAPNTVGMSIAGVLRQSWSSSTVGINADLAVTGDFQASGDASVTGDLAVGGNTAIIGNLTVDGSFTGNAAGQILVPDGTAALPAYSFTSDPDTGMWHPAPNTLGWTLGAGVTAMQFAPGGLLSVAGSADSVTGFTSLNPNLGVAAATGFVATISGSISSQFLMTGPGYTGYPLAGPSAALMLADGVGGIAISARNASGSVRFSAGGGTEQMRLTPAGNLGINCIPPAGVQFRVQAQAANDVGLEWVRLNPAESELRSFDRQSPAWDKFTFGASDYQWNTTGVNRMSLSNAGVLTTASSINSGGNMSAGYSAPGGDVAIFISNFSNTVNSRAKLELSNGGTQTGSDAFTHYVNQGTWDWSTGIRAADSSYRIGVSSHLNSPVVTVTTGQQVGIGNSAPGFKLDVQSATSGVPALHLDVAGAPNQGMIKFGDRSFIAGGGDYQGWQFIDASTTRVWITNAGYLGINTGAAPAYPIDVTDGTAAVARLRHTSGASAFLQANANTDVRVGSLSNHSTLIIVNGQPKVTVPTGNDSIFVREGVTDFRVAICTESGAFGSGGITFPVGGILLGRGVGMPTMNPFSDVALGGAVTITIFGNATNTSFNVGTYRMLGRETNATNVDTVLWMRVG
jgi:hypothetical protein